MPTKTNHIDEEKVRISIEKMVAKYTELSPYFLHPDKTVVDNIIDGLVINKIKHGYAYCPCRDVEGVSEKDRVNICPCQSHREEIASQGTCECGLFVSKTYFHAHKRFGSNQT